jgi:hypothetical protein
MGAGCSSADDDGLTHGSTPNGRLSVATGSTGATAAPVVGSPKHANANPNPKGHQRGMSQEQQAKVLELERQWKAAEAMLRPLDFSHLVREEMERFSAGTRRDILSAVDRWLVLGIKAEGDASVAAPSVSSTSKVFWIKGGAGTGQCSKSASPRRKRCFCHIGRNCRSDRIRGSFAHSPAIVLCLLLVRRSLCPSLPAFLPLQQVKRAFRPNWPPNFPRKSSVSISAPPTFLSGPMHDAS